MPSATSFSVTRRMASGSCSCRAKVLTFPMTVIPPHSSFSAFRFTRASVLTASAESAGMCFFTASRRPQICTMALAPRPWTASTTRLIYGTA